MAEPTTLAEFLIDDELLRGVVRSLVTPGLRGAAKAVGEKLSEALTSLFRRAAPPGDNPLDGLARRALRQALVFTHAACAREVGNKEPFFLAVMRAWKEGRLFAQPLAGIRDTPAHLWLDGFGRAIRDEVDFDAFVRGLEQGDATQLAAAAVPAGAESLLHSRLSDWVAARVELLGPVLERPACFRQGLEEGPGQGFRVDGDSNRRLTVGAAWRLFFREGLQDSKHEEPFKAYVVAKLEEISATNAAGVDAAALAEEVSTHLVARLGERIPHVAYFDGRFAEVTSLIRSEAQRTRNHVTSVVEGAVGSAVDQLSAQSRAQFDRLAALPRGGETPTPTLPALPNTFVGREQEEAELLAVFRGPQRTAAIAGVRGQGGIGKTALALHVGHTLACEFPDGQAYIDLRGTTVPLTPRAAMETILRQLGSQQTFNNAPDDEVAALYRSLLAPRKVLLLLDNASDARQVGPLLPGGSCGVLVTSRRQFAIAGVQPLALDLLSEADAVALARGVAPRLTEADARDLSAACGRLALAIRIAATQIANYEGVPVAEHIAELRSDRLTYLDAVEHDDPDGLPFARRAIELSLERLPPDVRAFWARLGVFPADFGHDLATRVALDGNEPDLTRGRNLLERLRQNALLEFDAATGRYALHDLAREYAWRRGLPDDTSRTELSRRHAKVAFQTLAGANDQYLAGKQVEGLAVLNAEFASIVAGQRWAADHGQTDPVACRLAAGFYLAGGSVLKTRLVLTSQISWLTRALDACREIGERTSEAGVLGALGEAYRCLGEARVAMELQKQAMGIFRKKRNLQGQGYTLCNLGIVYFDLCRNRKAISCYKQALGIARKLRDVSLELAILNNLGNAHADLGQHRKAIEYHAISLELAIATHDALGEGNSLGNLGIVLAASGDFSRALECYERRVAIASVLGDRTGEANTLINRGRLFEKLARWGEAADDIQRAAEILAAIEHPNAPKAASLAEEFRRRAGE